MFEEEGGGAGMMCAMGGDGGGGGGVVAEKETKRLAAQPVKVCLALAGGTGITGVLGGGGGGCTAQEGQGGWQTATLQRHFGACRAGQMNSGSVGSMGPSPGGGGGNCGREAG
jgi:hypothetical protein